MKLVILLLLLIRYASSLQYGHITTVAGTDSSGYNGDGIAAIGAQLDYPGGLFVDSSDNIFFVDKNNNRLRKISSSTGLISTVAGNGARGYNADGIAATSASLDFVATYNPSGVYVDGNDNIFMADTSNNRIRKVSSSTGLISTVAGTGSGGYNGDGIAAVGADLKGPGGIFVESSGNIFIADSYNHRIRIVSSSTGLISTVAGTGSGGYNGDGIAATSADINIPFGLHVDGFGDIYIADFFNHRIRKVSSSTGLISTVAGTGSGGYNGDGIVATSADLGPTFGVHAYASGNLILSASGRILFVSQTTPAPTADPSPIPSASPTAVPYASPSPAPSVTPTTNPSPAPSASPIASPTAVPSPSPSPAPSAAPTPVPSLEPTESPTFLLSGEPSSVPSSIPTKTAATYAGKNTNVIVIAVSAAASITALGSISYYLYTRFVSQAPKIHTANTESP